MKLFAPNIDTKGRIARAVGALALAIAGAVLWPLSRIAAGLLAAGSAFMFFEAARGWCAVRACGIKTPL